LTFFLPFAAGFFFAAALRFFAIGFTPSRFAELRCTD
jgi:hypothetical protein